MRRLLLPVGGRGRLLASCLILPAFGLFARPVLGQFHAAPVAPRAATAEKPEEKTIGPFNGTVVDPNGKPAAGAKVLMLIVDAMPMEARVLAETVSDSKGQFRIGQQKQTLDSSTGRARPQLWVAR